MRHQLIEKIRREFSEFVLNLELDASRQKRRALKQPADHRVEPIAHQPAQALCDPGIFLGEFAGLLAQQGELFIIEFKKFAVHRLQPIDHDLA
jgi:hypothetical protein